ncbi:hypothetical protein HanIR_Chr10g0488731 [Helianthus annuus]|nr:hypothetical protein HanIR_Chr10g0488731 [Helianthus annuus]
MAFKELSGKALVGRCANIKMLNNIKSVLIEAGIQNFSLSYLGGMSVLVKFSNEEDSNSLVGSFDRWKNWFSTLDCWMGQSMPFERIAWIKFFGVPIHLAVDEIYDSIAGRFGKVIHASQRSSEDSDLSVNCIGVLIGDGTRIAEESTIKWKDRMYKVWVEEELADWIPKCLESKEPSEEEAFSSQFIVAEKDGIPASHREESKEGRKGIGSSSEVHGSLRVHDRSEER